MIEELDKIKVPNEEALKKEVETYRKYSFEVSNALTSAEMEKRDPIDYSEKEFERQGSSIERLQTEIVNLRNKYDIVIESKDVMNEIERLLKVVS